MKIELRHSVARSLLPGNMFGIPVIGKWGQSRILLSSFRV